MCFIARNPNLKNGGDDVLQIALFLLLISPCNAALSVDRWLKCKSKRESCDQEQMPMIDPWPVRLFQIQLCVMYTTTAIAKMRGHTWFDGTSIHNVLNDVTMSRWSYAQLPLPIYVTAPMTWVSLAFEFFFPLLIWNRRIRPLIFLFGVAFHLGIYLMVEVGWFQLLHDCDVFSVDSGVILESILPAIESFGLIRIVRNQKKARLLNAIGPKLANGRYRKANLPIHSNELDR